MRRTPRSLADAREELVQIQEEFTRLQKRIEVVRDCVKDSLVRFFGEQRPAFTGLQEEELIERIAGRVVARLNIAPTSQPSGEKKYVRDTVAAKYLGVSAFALRSWRSRGKPRLSFTVQTECSVPLQYELWKLNPLLKSRASIQWTAAYSWNSKTASVLSIRRPCYVPLCHRPSNSKLEMMPRSQRRSLRGQHRGLNPQLLPIA